MSHSQSMRLTTTMNGHSPNIDRFNESGRIVVKRNIYKITTNIKGGLSQQHFEVTLQKTNGPYLINLSVT